MISLARPWTGRARESSSEVNPGGSAVMVLSSAGLLLGRGDELVGEEGVAF